MIPGGSPAAGRASGTASTRCSCGPRTGRSQSRSTGSSSAAWTSWSSGAEPEALADPVALLRGVLRELVAHSRRREREPTVGADLEPPDGRGASDEEASRVGPTVRQCDLVVAEARQAQRRPVAARLQLGPLLPGEDLAGLGDARSGDDEAVHRLGPLGPERDAREVLRAATDRPDPAQLARERGGHG